MAQITLNSSGVASNGTLALQSNGTTTAVTINASQGVEFNAGTAAAPTITATGDTNTGIFFPAADQVAITTGGTQRAVVDASGNVGIGTSSPGDKLSVNGACNLGGASGVRIGIGTAFVAGQAEVFSQDSVRFGIGTAGAQPVSFYSNSAERMRIDSSGNLLVGTTSVPTNGASGAGAATFSDYINVRGITSHAGISGAYQTNRMNLQWNGSATRLWVDTTDTGSITVSSDYRVKKDIETQTQNALSRIALIRPVTYTYADYEPFSWKADGVSREGFIAHELQVVVPSAVDGEKDAENQIQSLKLDALCAVMVKAIQEMKAIIDTQASTITQLQADVAALKGTA